MIATIITIVIALVIIAVSALIVTGATADNKTVKPHIGTAIGGALGVILGVGIFIAAFGWRQVDTGSVGVLLQFGQVQGTLSPGLHWYPPVLYDVQGMDTRVRAYNFGGDPSTEGAGIEAFTQENQKALMFGVVNYHIDPSFAHIIFQQVGPDYFEKVIQHQADTEVKRDARAYTTDNITSHRDELAAAALTRLQADVAPYHIIIDGMFISQIGLPETYLEAVNLKLIAQQNVEKERNNAEAALQQGRAQANLLREQAQGQADANRLITESLSDELIRWQAIQKLNPNVNVMMVPDNGVLLNLPLGTPAPTSNP